MKTPKTDIRKLRHSQALYKRIKSGSLKVFTITPKTTLQEIAAIENLLNTKIIKFSDFKYNKQPTPLI
jgi:hypothetical protein